MGSVGAATQQFTEGYTFALENLAQVTTTNSLGTANTQTYQYNDSVSKERVTAITIPSAPTGDYFAYDRRGRGLITGHMLTSTQSPAQDGYEYDVQARLISISKLGAKVEDLTYDPASSLVSRTFAPPITTASGTETARYYMGDDLTVVKGTQSNSTKQVGYAHIRLGSRRIASIWAKTVGTTATSGFIYYHRDVRGSVVATTTAGGVEANSYRYLPSGAVDKLVGAEVDETASELGYIGGIKLSGGLVHLRARAYSPLARRFLQPDTIDFARYTYGRGDFLNYTDPSGRSRQEARAILRIPGASVEGLSGYVVDGFSGGVGFTESGIMTFAGYSSPPPAANGSAAGRGGGGSGGDASGGSANTPAGNDGSANASVGPTCPGRSCAEEITVTGTRKAKGGIGGIAGSFWSLLASIVVQLPTPQQLFDAAMKKVSWSGPSQATRSMQKHNERTPSRYGGTRPGTEARAQEIVEEVVTNPDAKVGITPKGNLQFETGEAGMQFKPSQTELGNWEFRGFTETPGVNTPWWIRSGGQLPEFIEPSVVEPIVLPEFIIP